MLRLKKVQKKDKDLFWNINQKYLYEMTNFYDDSMDENGNYHYGHFDEYFSDPKRTAYFIYNDDVLVGFAMLCPYSNIERNPVIVVTPSNNDSLLYGKILHAIFVTDQI